MKLLKSSCIVVCIHIGMEMQLALELESDRGSKPVFELLLVLEPERIAKNLNPRGRNCGGNVASKPGLIPAALAVDLTYHR